MLLIKYVLIVLVALLLFNVISYIGVPVYKFEHGRSFSGDRIYDPYAGIDSSSWKKGNFHAHQSEKPQCDYTVEQMLEAYRSNGYDIMSISDHQKLNLAHSDRQGFIPTYEHGYNINRYHLLMMGATDVSWRDYPIMLTQSQMQYMMYKMKPQCEVLVLNHPGQIRIVDHSVYGLLRGYDLTEINPDRGTQCSFSRWDTALSAGIYSNLIADDDAHNITNRGSWFQRSFTMVNTPSFEKRDIFEALRLGRAYGVYVPWDVNSRPDPHADLPRAEDIAFSGDTLTVRLSRPAQSIRFIGQNGGLLSEIRDAAQGSYRFAAGDTYVRAEAEFDNGVGLYFNPYVRTASGNQPTNVFVPIINYPLTVLVHALWLSLAYVLGVLLARLLGVRPRWLYPRWNLGMY